ncbi:hypothetical protein CRV24_006157 [Beauveria bassiana]|nr:hypothetical protein CRV24_006157 [Beauveria bassiana]KAH8708854.1 hypothetical protein HC256_008790 [Beauveria bassiana]
MSFITNIASCDTGYLGHRIFMVNKSNHLAILHVKDPEEAHGLSPKEIDVGGDAVEANPTNNIGVRVYFATNTKMLSELTWNSVDQVYKFGQLNGKRYEVIDKSTITAEIEATNSQAAKPHEAVRYVYCNLKKYSSDFNVVFGNDRGWNDRNMS